MPMDLPPKVDPIVIVEDGGGTVAKYQDLVRRYNYENREVRIMGSCRSACILFLGVKNVCVGPQAVVKAHYAYEPNTQRIRLDITAEMMNEIPYRVSARLTPYMTEHYNKMTILNSGQLQDLGIRRCGPEAVTASDNEPRRKQAATTLKPGNEVTKLFMNLLGVMK